jgi:predicted  nucleic acid-binding Zn-ribbon protein
MAWYRNHYHCGDCGTDWEDEWSCCCDDECPECGSRHWSPVESEDLTEMVASDARGFVVVRSSADADDKPGYRVLAKLSNVVAAERFKATGEII